MRIRTVEYGESHPPKTEQKALDLKVLIVYTEAIRFVRRIH
tara:strand:- start:419 stop:541 length:123 start_codon:yes stop_codon:yes gene_type:complete